MELASALVLSVFTLFCGLVIGYWVGQLEKAGNTLAGRFDWTLPAKQRVRWNRRPRPQAPGHSEWFIAINEHCEIHVMDSPHPAYKGWYINARIGDHHFKDEEIADELNVQFIRPTTVEEAKEIGESFVSWCQDKTEELYPAEPEPQEVKAND